MSAQAGQEVIRLLYAEDSPRSGESEEGEYEENSLRSQRQGERLAAFDAAVAETAAQVLPAYNASEDWLERIRASLLALLEAFDERPETARLLIDDSIAWGPEVLERRGELLEILAEALDDPRGKVDPVEPLPETAGENLVGASLSWVHARLQGGSGRLVELAPSLMSMIVHTYLGAEAAQRELERPHTELGTMLARHEGEGPDAPHRTQAPQAAVPSHGHGSTQALSSARDPLARLRRTPS